MTVASTAPEPGPPSPDESARCSATSQATVGSVTAASGVRSAFRFGAERGQVVAEHPLDDRAHRGVLDFAARRRRGGALNRPGAPTKAG